MPVIEKTIALLAALEPADVQALPPFERRRFADLCRHLADLAERPDPPKAGILSRLQNGERSH